MEEIKVKILGQIGHSYNINKIEVVPLERLSGPLNAGKTYKLVEDVPDGFVTASFKNNPLVNLSIDEKKQLLNSFYGSKSFKFVIDKDEMDKWIKANPNIKPIILFTGTRSGGKTATQTELVRNYIQQDVESVSKIIASTTYGVFGKAKVMFNGNATILEIGDFKVVVKCDEKDKFSYYIGLGLALSRYYEKQPSTKIEIKYLKDELNYKKLAHYCLHKYFSFDTKRVDKFLKSCEKNKWVDLC